MKPRFFATLTHYGEQVLANAIANNQPLNITKMAVGDGNGQEVIPDQTQTTLVNEVYRSTLNDISKNPQNDHQVIFELLIPSEVGGFWSREMGIFDESEKLVAVANCPASFKPILASGSGKVQVLRMILQVSSSDAVTLSVDDGVIMVTRDELNKVKTQINQRITDLSNPDGFKFIGQAESVEQLRTIEPTADQQRILLKSWHAGKNLGGGEFYADFADNSTADNGGTVILTTGGKRWKRISNSLYLSDFGNQNIPRVQYGSLHIPYQQIEGVEPFKTRAFSSLRGDGYGAILKNTHVNTYQNFATHNDYSIKSDVLKPEIYALEINDQLNNVQPYFNDVRNINIQYSSGIKLGSIETTIDNVRIFGKSNNERSERGIYCQKATSSGELKSFDISLSNIYTQWVKRGFECHGAFIMYNGHFVRADQAVRILGENRKDTKPSQRTVFGAYLDAPKHEGVRLYGTNGVALYSPYFYQVGKDNTDNVGVFGLFLAENCQNNFVCAPSFNQGSVKGVHSLINISDEAVDNTIIHPSGDCILNERSIENIRKQNVIAGTGGWARFNNFARLNRVNESFEPGETKTLNFYLDFNYQNLVWTACLFKGAWISRGLRGDINFGDLSLMFRFDDVLKEQNIIKLSEKGEYLTSSTPAQWEVVNGTINGDVISLTLKNNSAQKAAFSAEIQRSIDSAGLTF